MERAHPGWFANIYGRWLGNVTQASHLRITLGGMEVGLVCVCVCVCVCVGVLLWDSAGDDTDESDDLETT